MDFNFKRCYWILIWGLLFFTTVLGVTPDRAVMQFNPDSILSIAYWYYPRTQMTLSVYDSSGNPVPAHTPIAIGVSNQYGAAAGRFFSSQQFKEIPGGNTTRYTFFWTDSNGQVTAEFAPGIYVNSQNYLIFSVHPVIFSDPQDPQTAQAQFKNILDLNQSQSLKLITLKDYSVQTTSIHNDEFVYEWVHLEQPESARVSVQVFDESGKPVPENVPVAIFLYYPNWSGKFKSNQIFFEEYSPRSGGQQWDIMKYYAFTATNGKVELTYYPANNGTVTLNNTTISDYGNIPWHLWYKNNGSYYNSQEEAFAAWKQRRTVPVEVLVMNMRDTSAVYTIPKRSGEFPVLVGPDAVSYTHLTLPTN